MEQVRTKYELFFSGRERREPNTDRVQLEAMSRKLHSAFITNSGQIFRLRTLTARLTTYQTYWDRVLREMEEGTFKLEIDRRKIIQKDLAVGRAAERKGEGYIGMNEYLDGSMDEEIRRATEEAAESARLPEKQPPHEKPVPERSFWQINDEPAAPVVEKPSQPPRPGGSQIEELYRSFIEAKRASGESVAGLTMETFSKQIAGKLAALKKTFGTGVFNLKVAIKDGRTTIKAVPGKKE
jgi:hypothetical protein